MKTHLYQTKINWEGETKHYSSYSRNHVLEIAGKEQALELSSDPAFRGDARHYNPEELLLASISSCHMLWFLHLCTLEKVVVLKYIDQAEGEMEEQEDGSGRFTSVKLHPKDWVSHESMVEKVETIHAKAHKMCFIANSCNFPISHLAETYLNPD